MVVLALFGFAAQSPAATIVALFLMGGFGLGTVPGLQSRIMNYAGQASTLASGANVDAFNAGNALGAWAGGVGIAAGLGHTSPIWIGATITARPCGTGGWPWIPRHLDARRPATVAAHLRRAGQVFDPIAYLGYLAAATTNTLLATAAVVLPLRHPLMLLSLRLRRR